MFRKETKKTWSKNSKGAADTAVFPFFLLLLLILCWNDYTPLWTILKKQYVLLWKLCLPNVICFIGVSLALLLASTFVRRCWNVVNVTSNLSYRYKLVPGFSATAIVCRIQRNEGCGITNHTTGNMCLCMLGYKLTSFSKLFFHIILCRSQLSGRRRLGVVRKFI